jgi:hypothetical protein
MDTRPLIHFWLNKPECLDDHEDHQKCRMAVRTYNQVRGIEDVYGSCKFRYSTVTWGDPNRMMELWIDVDRMVEDLDACVILALHTYALSVNGSDDWESWPTPVRELREAFEYIAESVFK